MVEASGHGRTAGPKRGSRVLPDSSVRETREDPRESFLKKRDKHEEDRYIVL